ncbi:MerC domain-containing protein [Flavobacteriaceae bacterium]|nr:MerC domain-containing protein [Flavobacteriaceae bacterium]
MNLILKKPDTVGAIASILCMLHCVLTPFIFLTYPGQIDHVQGSPVWWQNFNYIFIIISFFAVYKSVKTTSNSIIKYALWSSWIVLLSLIINEQYEWVSLPEFMTYITTSLLAILHIYNLNYCQCENCTKK